MRLVRPCRRCSTGPDTVTRSQAGRVTAESVAATGETARFASYGYDSVGRLATADVAGHALVYGYGDQGSSCPGGASASGRNTNRTSVTDNAVTTTYCYDRADRLTATTDATVATPGYDTHGNTTTLGGGGGAHTLAYDSSDRHTTTVNGATTVGYTRDATGRVVARAATGQATLRYGYTGGGDSPDVVSDATGAPLERSVPLPGGVTVTRRGGGTEVWSYPDVHGDTVATADRTGTKAGPTLAYDPYGQALAGVPDTSSGNLDYGWLGRHQRPTEHATALPVVEMGARPYLPNLGRFTQPDPVQGGSCNNYEYTCADPVNQYDLDGKASTPVANVGAGAIVLSGGLCRGRARGDRRGRAALIGEGAAALPARKRGWTCQATCNVQKIRQRAKCPPRTHGSASGSSQEEACRNAKRVATQAAPSGCYARHCQCRCQR